VRRRYLLVMGVCLAAVAGVLSFSSCSSEAVAESQSSGPPRAVTVGVTTVKSRDLPIVLSGLGTVVPSQSVTVRSRVAGQLERVSFREGELVSRGQVLAEIDPRSLQARVTQTAGQLAKDRVLLANARVELQRARALAENRLISEQEVANLASSLEQHQAAEQISRGVHASAELELSYTRITAPIHGRIGFRQLDVGNNVDAAAPLAVIHRLQPITVLFTLPEDVVPTIVRAMKQAGDAKQELEVEAWDKGARNLLARGTLLTIDNQIDAATGTVKLKAEFANDGGTLFPNQFVNIRFVVEVVRNATVVPVAAIQRGRDGPFAYVVGADQVAAVRKLVLGSSDGGESAVLQGLIVGERVVVQGIDQVREGVRVSPSDPTRSREGEPPRDPTRARSNPEQPRTPRP
jgi:membrane fusion protein, multidrug efflux system